VPVDDALGILARKREAKKLVEEARGFQPELPVVFVDVEQAALRSRVGRSFGFINRRGDAVDVQDTCERQSAKAGTDDGDAGISRWRGVVQVAVHGAFR
jgi:hypothetical protein